LVEFLVSYPREKTIVKRSRSREKETEGNEERFPMGSIETEKRSEHRRIVEEYYSVEFSIFGVEMTYQFKIWNISTKGLCVLVRPESDILKHLKVGETIQMKFCRDDASKQADFINTKIHHITKDDTGKFRGHYLVGLSIAQD
jgi:hypothetical protein